MSNEFDPTERPDPAVAKATWAIGVAAALVLGMAIGVAMAGATTSGVVRPAGTSCESVSIGSVSIGSVPSDGDQSRHGTVDTGIPEQDSPSLGE